MRRDKELILIAQDIVQDDIGNDEEEVETRRKILCSVKSVGRNEFYSAATSDFKPEFVFIVYPFEYENERKVEFKGKKYRVIRTYEKNFKELELICGRVGADVRS